MSDPVEEFLSSLPAERTRKRYAAILADFTTWYRGTYGQEPEWPLLTAVELRDYASYLESVRRYAPATVNLHLAALRGLLRSQGRELKVRGPKEVRPPVEALSARELGRLLAAAEGSARDTALLNLMARAGLRVGEVTALTLDDVELGERAGWVTVRAGKGDKTRRVPLGAEARKALKAWLAERPQDAPTSALFVSHTGRPLQPRAVDWLVAEYARQARVKASPHTLRHTFATRALEHGADLASLQRLLGHAHLETTGRYLHPSAEKLQQAVEEL